MYNVKMNLQKDHIQIIQIRIIDLTNKKISLNRRLHDLMKKIETEDHKILLRELNRDRRDVIDKIVECEKMLHLNKQLLNQTNEHEYELEC